MAIEDAFELGELLGAELDGRASPSAVDVKDVLWRYQNARVVRAAAVHGMAGMAAFMASTYKVCREEERVGG